MELLCESERADGVFVSAAACLKERTGRERRLLHSATGDPPAGNMHTHRAQCVQAEMLSCCLRPVCSCVLPASGAATLLTCSDFFTVIKCRDVVDG